MVTVGTRIAPRPPHKSRRALLTYRAPPSGSGVEAVELEFLVVAVDDVHFNPVKHKVVRRARDWPYSSFHVYVRRGLLPADWAGDVEEPMMDFGERRG